MSTTLNRLIRFIIPPERAGGALLDFLSVRFTYHSAVEWQERMTSGRVTVNGQRATPEQILTTGDELAYDASGIPEPPMDDRIRLVHCDDDLVVVDKSGNLTCHPGGRYFNHTLWGLLQTRHGIAKPTFINRIDRETSGLVVIARTSAATKNLRAQFADRRVEKRYEALVEGAFPDRVACAGWVVADFSGEVLKQRRFISVRTEGRAHTSSSVDAAGGRVFPRPAVAATDGSGRRDACTTTLFHDASDSPAPPTPDAQWAVTAFRREAVHGPISHVTAWPHTGRLHQIRVTLQSLGFPLVGDKLYGKDPGCFLRFCRDELTSEDRARLRLPRQALHAAGLRFHHPRTGQEMAFDLPLPDDMQAVIHACAAM